MTPTSLVLEDICAWLLGDGVLAVDLVVGGSLVTIEVLVGDTAHLKVEVQS